MENEMESNAKVELNPEWEATVDRIMHTSIMNRNKVIEKDDDDDDDKMIREEEDESSEEEEEDNTPPATPIKKSKPRRRRPPTPISASSSEGEESDDEIDERLQHSKRLLEEEKLDLLARLQTFIDEKHFRPFKTMSPNDKIEDIRYEFFRAQREIKRKNSIKSMQKALITTAAGIETLSGVFNPFNLQLQGYSKSVMLSIKDYDDVFEELHWRYCDSFNFPPELRLAYMLSTSIYTYHSINKDQQPEKSKGKGPDIFSGMAMLQQILGNNF